MKRHTVREYIRIRNGKAETVRQHMRGDELGTDTVKPKRKFGTLGIIVWGCIGIYVLYAIIAAFLGSSANYLERSKQAIVAEKAEKTDAKKSEKAEKALTKDINASGYTEKFDTTAEKLGLSDDDVDTIVERMKAQVKAYSDVEVDPAAIIYVDPEAFDNSANYKAAILVRLRTMSRTPVSVVTVYSNVKDKKADKVYESLVNVCRMNTNVDNGIYNSTDIKAFNGFPESGQLTVTVTYSVTESTN